MSRKIIKIGSVEIGAGRPIAVQSMTNTNTADTASTVAQIERLTKAGCEIVRVAVPDMAAAINLAMIKERISIPLVADIQFDHRLALRAITAGVDMLRLNPGNITDSRKIAAVAHAAKRAGIPIRVGVNSGSLDPSFRNHRGKVSAEGMVASALREVSLLEREGFTDIVISVKATDVKTTIDAYRLVAQRLDYPLHIGITEAGTALEGAIRSAVGLGILLSEGIGDTIRVSLTGDPVQEVHVAYEILKTLGLRQRGITYRICPTCGRTKINLAQIATQIQHQLADITEPLVIALMGCVVNGVGEVQEAAIGLVGGDGEGTIYVDGKCVKRAVPEEALVREIVKITRSYLAKS
ncbi:flavodoxin-dependent (E)-4-hydroxy-3-methylbut-2-enyl-diphosphate synthase [Candidatus Acetothermia bacterium]|nr:flavodoxin-dependent (E)-4-hydroxy-3-methylbut-2-enyl-diphosphate synthase [Candidatus Acetothermia bacterium]